MILQKRFFIGVVVSLTIFIVLFMSRYSQVGVPRSLPGYIEKREVSLGFVVPGQIITLLVDEGQSVVTGQALAHLDPEPYRYEVDQARADLKDKEASKIFAFRERDRQAELQQTHASTPREFDQAQSLAERAQAAYDLALARYEQALYRYNQTTLLAPSNGVLTRRMLEAGSIVNQQPVFVLTLTDPIWVRAYAQANQLELCQSGTPVTIQTDSGRIFSGVIGYISPQAEFTPKAVQTSELRPQLVYRMRIVLNDNQDNHGLRQGVPVTVFIPSSL